MSTTQVDTQPDGDTSPVQHQAQLLASLQARDLVRFSRLLQQTTADADSSCLEAACRQPDCEEFVQLLLRHGADPNTLNPVLQEAPLHITAELGHYETLRILLLDPRININALNGSEQTVLHVVVKKCWNLSREEEENFRRCLILLLEWPGDSSVLGGTMESLHVLDVNVADWLGNTALHYAAQNKDQDSILVLLKHGSYIGTRNHAGDTPVSGIEPDTLETFLNTCLKMPGDDSLLFNYDFLVPPTDLASCLKKSELLSDDTQALSTKIHSPSPEMDPLVQISRSSKLQHLVLHPILSSFIHLKWQKVRKFYYYNLAFYVIFVVVLTYIVLENCMRGHHHHHRTDPSCLSKFTALCFLSVIAHVLLAVCCFCLIVKLIFQVSISVRQYLHKCHSHLQLILTMLALVVLFRGWHRGENALTSITLFLAWSQLLFLTGKHPAISICYHLFNKISSIYLRYIAWYSLLIIAFSLGFYALFHDSKTYISEKSVSIKLFHNPAASLFTTIGMFMGGFETKFLPFESAAGTSHIIFILFTFLLSIVFLNILTGLAVGYTQVVQEKAELVRLRAKVNAMSDIEKLILGNPLRIHLRMRQLYLSHNTIVVQIVRSSVYLWLMCNWLRYFRNLHRNLVLFPNYSYDHARILFPFGNNSKVTCDYSMDSRVLRRAANIVQDKDDKTRQQLEARLAECQAMYSSYKERLDHIEASLVRSEMLQRDILQLLQSLVKTQE